MQKTHQAKPNELERSWVLVDLENQVLGRAATKIAMMLRGKDKPNFTPHVDSGNFVVVINAAKVRLTGKKMDDKIYYKHTGFPGGIKSINARELLARDPERVIQEAVWGMLPKNTLSRSLLSKMKVYAGSEHPHVSQSPEKITLEE